MATIIPHHPETPSSPPAPSWRDLGWALLIAALTIMAVVGEPVEAAPRAAAPSVALVAAG